MTYDELKTVLTLQTLAWTFPLILGCIMVVYECNKSLRSCLKKHTDQSRQMCWMLFGIFFSFIGKIVESAWWFIPWTAAYIDHPKWSMLNGFGVFINLPFRQLSFTLAAYCYLRAFLAPQRGGGLRILNVMLVLSLISGQVFIWLLWMIKHGHI